MPAAMVNSKGQITLPEEVRRALGVETGDRIEFVETCKGVFEVVAASRDVRELKGMIDRPRRPVRVEDMRKAPVQPIEIYGERRTREFKAAEAQLEKVLRRRKKTAR